MSTEQLHDIHSPFNACMYRDAIRSEHAQRVTMQHHACDLAQHIEELATERDELRAQVHIVTSERDELASGMAALRARLAEIESRPAIPDGWRLACTFGEAASIGSEEEADNARERFLGALNAALADAKREGAEQMRTRAAAIVTRHPLYYGSGDGVSDELAQAIEDLPLPTGERKDEPLVCDVCGAECADPWHYSSGERRHMHACDACWPGVRKQGGGRQAVLLTDAQMEGATRSAWDDLLDHIYEYGTASEGLHCRMREVARAVETDVLAANGLETK